MVAADALGQTHTGAVSGARFSLTFPRLPAERDEGYFLEPPDDHPERLPLMPDHTWGAMSFANNPPHPRPLVAYVEAVVTEIDLDDQWGGEFYDVARRFGNLFDNWYIRALSWIELWTGQMVYLDQGSPFVWSRGQVSEVTDESRHLTGWGGVGGEIHIQPSTVAASAHVLASAFARASEETEPPTEWQLYLRALRLRDSRLAVIEAATAAEVALSRAINTRLDTLSERARDRIVENANGIVGQVQILEDLDGVDPEQSTRKRVADRLAGPRNRAAHRGLPPDADTGGKALAEARRLLDSYSPLPPP